MDNNLQNNKLHLRIKKRLNFYIQKFNIKMNFLLKKERQIEKELEKIESKARLQKLRQFVDKQN